MIDFFFYIGDVTYIKLSDITYCIVG